MSKRKLTRRQQWRIEKIQQEKAKRAQRQDSAVNADQLSTQEEPGLVISHLGKRILVEPEAGQTSIPCHFRANINAIVTGDRVAFRRDDHGQGVVESLLPRTSLLARPDVRGQLKPVASNIDFMILVITPEPAPSSILIDRYLVAAELQQIPVRILLNKQDLLTPANQASIEQLLARYQRIGYATWQCSTRTGQGLEQLQGQLDQHTSVFVGQSGVGKSSLVNALLPAANAAVGELSEQSRLGRHTTTNAHLFHFPTGGNLIDSPGIREFGLWHIEPEQVIEGFVDFSPWRFQCRFRDCRHQQEPGCALREAAARGDVDSQRLHNYFAICESLAADH